MPYKKDGDDIIEYRIIPEQEQVMRRIKPEELDKMILAADTAVKSHDVVKYGTEPLKAKQAKLAELQAAKAEMEKI